MSDQPIQLARPDISEADEQMVIQALRSGILSRGRKLAEFEALFAQMLGCKHAIGLSNGTAALHCALMSAEVQSNDEVITCAYTVPASINPILALGARPVLVDIDPHTRTLDTDRVSQAITARTKAVLCVHPFGQPADIVQLQQICEQHGISLIEDACQALGTQINHRSLGTFGQTGAFGFYPNKQITTGEGGMLVTDDDRIAEQCRRWRNHGRQMNGRWLDQDTTGYNYRMSELPAALGYSQLQRLPKIIEKRQVLVDAYQQRLSSIEPLHLPHPTEGCNQVSWFAYVIQLHQDIPSDQRDCIVSELADQQIQLGRYFSPLHRQPGLQDRLKLSNAGLPITESISARSIALPFHHDLSDRDIDRVCNALVRALR